MGETEKSVEEREDGGCQQIEVVGEDWLGQLEVAAGVVEMVE